MTETPNSSKSRWHRYFLVKTVKHTLCRTWTCATRFTHQCIQPDYRFSNKLEFTTYTLLFFSWLSQRRGKNLRVLKKCDYVCSSEKQPGQYCSPLADWAIPDLRDPQ
jgi:hypothetical protein